ncbi:MAG: Gfo/Idh/MocA family protein [Planctomycetota bacterium]|jgi:predicted dehydrogenase
MTVRVGMIGSGGIGNRHAQALAKVEGAQLVAAADVDLARAEKILEGQGKAYSDFIEMLSSEKLDAVYVCTPPHAHGGIELAASEHVGAVMIEKPVGNDLATCLKIQEAFEKAGTIAGAAYMNRYRRSSERAKELLSDPDDPPVYVEGRWVGGMPGVAWWRDRSKSGGQMNEQCTHVVDLARWLVGDVVEVSAYGAKGFVKGVSDYTVEDAVVMNVRFASGAVGTISTGCFAKGGVGTGVGLTVCSRGVKCELGGWGMALEASLAGGEKVTVPGQDDIFIVEDRAFIEAVEKKDASLVRSPYADAVKTLAVCLAANESMDTGKPIKLS